MGKRVSRLLIGLGAVGILGLGLVGFVAYQFSKLKVPQPDEMFGDQNLKTSVALLELHRTRNGSYPATLSDLQYIGDWDHIALSSVRYCPSADRTAYYLEVTRGWIGKPKLTLPPDFWRGTGYREAPTDLEQLDAWLSAAATAASIDELFR